MTEPTARYQAVPVRNDGATVQHCIDRLLDAAAMAGLLGAALSHWQENNSDIDGASTVAYRIQSELLEVQDDLTTLKHRTNRPMATLPPDERYCNLAD